MVTSTHQPAALGTLCPIYRLRASPARKASALVCTEYRPNTRGWGCGRALPTNIRTGRSAEAEPGSTSPCSAPSPNTTSDDATGCPCTTAGPSNAQTQASQTRARPAHRPMALADGQTRCDRAPRAVCGRSPCHGQVCLSSGGCPRRLPAPCRITGQGGNDSSKNGGVEPSHGCCTYLIQLGRSLPRSFH